MRIEKSANEISVCRNELMVFAALGIFLMHVICESMLSFFPALDKLLVMYGSTGVDIFLFVSGMGCFCSLSKGREKPVKWIGRHFLKVYIPYTL